MPGKMFGAGQHPAVLQTHEVLKGLGGHIAAAFAKRSVVDHRIQRVIIDIRYRCKVDVHPKAPALPGQVTAHFIDQQIVLNSAKHDLLRI